MTSSIVTDRGLKHIRAVAAKIAITTTDPTQPIVQLQEIPAALMAAPPELAYPALSATWADIITRHPAEAFLDDQGHISFAEHLGMSAIVTPARDDLVADLQDPEQRLTTESISTNDRVAAVAPAAEEYCRAYAAGAHHRAGQIMTDATADHHPSMLAWLIILATAAAICATTPCSGHTDTKENKNK